MLPIFRVYMDKSDELHIKEYEAHLARLDKLKPWFERTPAVITTHEEAIKVRRDSINTCIELIKKRYEN